MASEIIPFIVFECPINVTSLSGSSNDDISDDFSQFSIQALVFDDQSINIGFGAFTSNSSSLKVTNSKFISPHEKDRSSMGDRNAVSLWRISDYFEK